MQEPYKGVMIIHTSSFFSVPNDLSHADGIRVSIANTQPKHLKYAEIKSAQPGWTLVNAYKEKQIDETIYKDRYINTLSFGQFIKELRNLGYETVILCCWEPRNTFCHRHILASLIRENGREFGMVLGQEF